MLDQITLCLTIGKRPQQLLTSLSSLIERVPFQHIIAINDFGDDETNHVFKQLCPQATLISNAVHMGHHLAIDTLYSQIKTPYIFHTEDDWLFDQPIYIDCYISLLEQYPQATMLCMRKWQDFQFSPDIQAKIMPQATQPLATLRFDALHDQWYGYSFNPHITTLDI